MITCKNGTILIGGYNIKWMRCRFKVRTFGTQAYNSRDDVTIIFKDGSKAFNWIMNQLNQPHRKIVIYQDARRGYWKEEGTWKKLTEVNSQ